MTASPAVPVQTSVATRLGCPLAVKRAGDEGEPVLFIQGTGLHGDGWRPQTDALSATHRCVWFDNRGMGASLPRGEAPVTVETMAEDALAVLDHVGLEQAHVVGHSLGGCIALQLALMAPTRVRSLSLLCTSSSGPGLVKLGGAMLWRSVRTLVGTRRSRRRAFLEIVLTPKEHAEADLDQLAADLEPLFGHDLAVQPPVAMAQVRAMSRWDVTDRLGELAGMPTLVVGAEHDVIARPPLVDLLERGLPSANVVRLDAAHGVTVTDPPTINRLLVEHVASVG